MTKFFKDYIDVEIVKKELKEFGFSDRNISGIISNRKVYNFDISNCLSKIKKLVAYNKFTHSNVSSMLHSSCPKLKDVLVGIFLFLDEKNLKALLVLTSLATPI